MTKYSSSSLERVLFIYPKPRYFMMFEAERNLRIDVGKGEHAKKIFEQYFDSKSTQEQKSLLEHYEKMPKTKNKKGKQKS